MKILHVSDLHNRPQWCDWVSANAGNYDLLCLSGDLQDAFSNVGMHTQARSISRWLLQLPTPTVVCTGNHDWWPEDDRCRDVYAAGGWLRMLAGKGNIVAVDGDAAEIGGMKIAAIGWNQPPEWPDGTDVVVCHAPPASMPVAGNELGCDHGEQETWHALWETPARFFLCGHIHAPRRHWCWFPPATRQTLLLNTGCSFSSDEPYHWDIDTAKGLAVWHGAGTDEVEFSP